MIPFAHPALLAAITGAEHKLRTRYREIDRAITKRMGCGAISPHDGEQAVREKKQKRAQTITWEEYRRMKVIDDALFKYEYEYEALKAVRAKMIRPDMHDNCLKALHVRLYRLQACIETEKD